MWKAVIYKGILAFTGRKNIILFRDIEEAKDYSLIWNNPPSTCFSLGYGYADNTGHFQRPEFKNNTFY